MIKNTAYSEKVLKHFRNPHNLGEIKNASGVGEVGNIVCGDVMKLYIKIKKVKDEEIIDDVKFETYGCAAAIATSSVITDLVKGKSLIWATKLNNKKIIDALGGLPPIKIHCSLLAVEALNMAIFNYLTKENRNIPAELKRKVDIIVKTRNKKDGKTTK